LKFFRRLRRNPSISKTNPDAIFALSSAYITLETKLGLKNTGRSALSLKVVDGMYFEDMKQDIQHFLDASKSEFGMKYRVVKDSYGYLWIIVETGRMEDNLAGLTAIGDTVEEKGFSDQLLAVVFEFSITMDKNSIAYMIYNYKRNKFYPFVPAGQKNRDSEQEMKILAAVDQELPFEKDMSLWYPMWDLPL
jgi:hypothetical protein